MMCYVDTPPAKQQDSWAERLTTTHTSTSVTFRLPGGRSGLVIAAQAISAALALFVQKSTLALAPYIPVLNDGVLRHARIKKHSTKLHYFLKLF